jgi:hypothetical protein
MYIIKYTKFKLSTKLRGLAGAMAPLNSKKKKK